MNKFIKNNMKVFIAVVISGIVFTGLGVYASQYLASDISFIPKNSDFKKQNGEVIDNVEDALNELYNTSNSEITKKLELKMRTSSYGINYGITNYMIHRTKINNYYKYFKIEKVTCNSYVESYATKAGSLSGTVELQNAIEYDFKDYSNIWTIVTSKENYKEAYCDVDLTFYNR